MATTTDTAARMDPRPAEALRHGSPAAAPPAKDGAQVWVTLAHLVRPQGRHGEMLGDIMTDFPERFSERRRVYLLSPGPSAVAREVTLEEHWIHKDRLVLKFTGIDSIEKAETLRGMDVVIPIEERAPLDEDSVYIADLAGCVFVDLATGREVGQIVDVDRESSNLPLIVVRTSTGGEVLIPFAKAYAPKIDLAERRMEMHLPEGLLTLDEPAAPEDVDGQGPTAALPGPPGQNVATNPRRRKRKG